MWVHMKGVKEMIRLRGGLQGMNDPLIGAVLVL